MAFAPCEIMVVMHVVSHSATNDPMHALDHPVSPGIGIATRKRHGGEVALTEFAILVDDGWRDVDALFYRLRLSNICLPTCVRGHGCRNAHRSKQSPPHRTSDRHSGCRTQRCRVDPA